MKVIRVFPRQTNATPVDDLTRTTEPEFWDEADEIHVSVTFAYDLPRAEQLAAEWADRGTVRIGGPATGARGEDFTPGRYLKPGYVITSRGCRNRCWFCSVWRREGTIRELPITVGNNVLDDNLLACSDEHIKAAFAMLKDQSNVQFTGGLEAAILQPWHVAAFRELKPSGLFFANDTPEDREPLYEAGKMLRAAGISRESNIGRAYVLIGYPRDTTELAEERLVDTVKAGFMPYAMLYRDKTGAIDPAWRRFQRGWSNHYIVGARMKKIWEGEG